MTNHFRLTRIFTAFLCLFGAVSLASAEENEAAPKDELPIVDISGDAWRQTVIAEGTPDVYQGHPTTLLLNDGQTLFCVWTFQHGGPCGPMAKSTDGGKTWVRQDEILPEVYAQTHRNCPTLQRIVSPDGKTERFFIFSSKGGKLGTIMSEDQGKTWRELEPANLSAGMPPTGLIRLKDGTTALFGQVRKDPNVKTDRAQDDQAIWMAITSDGGFTWSEPRVVAAADQKNLCEPFVLRSDDGNELCLLMRENRHTDRSMMCFSRDEGKTWTEPVNTCWGLTGDRHEGIQAPDGRWVIAFRDRALGSSTYGQFVAWVGTYDEIRNGKPGQFRIHLLQHHGEKKGWPSCDTGYSGMELLADGNILATTYTKHWPDARKHSVVCTRFKLSEIDPTKK
ncbi:MAG: glycoside hydrolase [Thermoguttaceae bacterium]|nr:glycoside hydrolase [Thermoguttaceae bacterium]